MIYNYEFYVAVLSKRGCLGYNGIHLFIKKSPDFWEYLTLSNTREGPFCFYSQYSPEVLRGIEDPQILMIYLSYVAEEIMSQHPELKIEVNYEGISKEFV